MLILATLLVLPSAQLPQTPEPISTSRGLIHPRNLLLQVDPGVRTNGLAAVHARLGGRLVRDLPQIHWQIVEVAPEQLFEAREAYLAEPAFVRADFDRAKRLAHTPNDPYWPMWHMQKIKADVAWDTLKGAPTVRVAVMDTGLDYTHPDLAANVWTNPGEIAGNSIDDDSNGYVDDVHGYDFAYNDPEPNDNYGHGTSCAGIVAARQDNNLGVTGVAPLCQLVGVKAALDSGYFYDSANVPALLYCADMSFQVISMSFYSDGVTPAEGDAINYCWSHGVLPVAAAGNDNQVLPYYPGAYENVLAVAATDQSDQKAWFSNYGTWVDVAAPGVSLSTVTTGAGYTTGFAGTSGATPHAAGLAGLLFAVPGATNAKVRAAIEDTAFTLIQAPYGQYVNYGRIDADAALQRMLGTTSGSKPARFLFAEPVAGGYHPFYAGNKPAPRPLITLYGVGFELPNVVRVLRNGVSIPIVERTRNWLAVAADAPSGLMEVEVNGAVIGSYQHDVDLGFVYTPTDISTQGNGGPVVTGAWKELSRQDSSLLTCTAGNNGVFVQMAIRKVNATPIAKLELDFRRAYDNSNGAIETVDFYDWSTASYPYGTFVTVASTAIANSSFQNVTGSITSLPARFVDPEGTMYVQITVSGVPSNAKLRADHFRVRVR